MEFDSFLAVNRFGLGRRLGEPLPQAPKDWLRAQLLADDPSGAAIGPETAMALAVVRERMDDLKAARKAQATPVPATAATPPPPDHPVYNQLKQDVNALLGHALVTQAPFRERLVWFWANHFNVSARGLVATGCAGAFVQDAIRPHVTGRFPDMLLAVMQHPAMLAYLDQVQSAGPDSMAGALRHKGLNENLARECLELHTVSPAAGYTQTDVTNFAKILTGWSIEVNQDPLGFKYRPRMHEPGEIEVMGRAWPQGEEGGRALLDWLGTHPATCRHLADKLVRHFVADDPPASDVRRIEAVLRDTRGDLQAACLAVIELPGAWVPGTKLRSPQDYVIACLRALGTTPEQAANIGGLTGALGQGMFQAPFPIGWPDRAADWAGPEALLQRVDFAYGQAGRAAALDPDDVSRNALGPLLHADTVSLMKGAASRRDAMTLFLSSPEFMRR